MEFTEPKPQSKSSEGLFLDREDLDKNQDPHLISQLNLGAGTLYSQYPPKFRTKSKLRSYEKVKNEAEYNPTQVLRLTRWNTMELPEIYKPNSAMQFYYDDKVFQYAPRKDDELYRQIDWHMNFAHSNLFIAYTSSLLAQDELQVLECPILASVREFLMNDPFNKDPTAKRFAPYTIGAGKATPVLIGNVDRLINLDTYPDASKGRPLGLYGNNFERASEEAVDLATNILKPPQRVNIFALEAPAGGYGNYTEGMITFILESCYTGFLAAKKESQKISVLLREENKVEAPVDPTDVKTNIFSGFWGCGAYGGDRELMVILQIIGAQLAGVDSLTIHAVHKEGKEAVEKALAKMSKIMKDVEEIKVEELIEKLEKAGFRWGMSNGT